MLLTGSRLSVHHQRPVNGKYLVGLVHQRVQIAGRIDRQQFLPFYILHAFFCHKALKASGGVIAADINEEKHIFIAGTVLFNGKYIQLVWLDPLFKMQGFVFPDLRNVRFQHFRNAG